MRNVAEKFIKSGISVIPIQNDGSKRPSIKSWGEYQKGFMQDFTSFKSDSWIASITGKVSGNLNLIDFDNHFGDIVEVFKEWANIPEVYAILTKSNLPIETTLRGGFHVFYRAPTTPPNAKYARRLRDGKAVTVIESRGEGGYVICAPTPGYNLINLDILNDGTTDNPIPQIFDTPTITAEEQNILISYAKTFNEVVEKKEIVKVRTGDGTRPGDDFAKSMEGMSQAVMALKAAGWTNPHGKYWTRPGKKRGVSATMGGKYDGYFHVFTSNGDPFESDKAYDFFQIVCILEHNGNFADFAKELASKGFGKSSYDERVTRSYSKVMTALRKNEHFDVKKVAQESGCDEEELQSFYDEQKEKNADMIGSENLPDIDKAELFLNSNYEFRTDVISKLSFMKYQGQDWEHMNLDSIYRLCQKNFIKFGLDKLKSLLRSDYVVKWNPFEDYFSSTPKWDGKDHISTMCECFDIKDSDKEYFTIMFKKMLVRAVKCSLDQSYYNRTVFTFVGDQDIGKSFFWRWLNPFNHEYYSEEPLRDNKDSRLSLTENFFYNLEELDSLSKFDLGKLKATISTQQVSDRLPFATHKERFFRCCTFVGSTNRDDFLIDDKNTRWLCFNVLKLRWNYTDIDKKQLWAQVVEMYNDSEFNCELTKEEAEVRDSKNEKFENQPFEELIVKKMFKRSDDHSSFMDNAEIMAAINFSNESLRINTTTQQLGKALSKCGFEKGTKKEVGTRRNRRGWFVAERTMVEIQQDVANIDNDIPF